MKTFEAGDSPPRPRLRLASLVRLLERLSSLEAVERLAVAAVLATPVALLVDYRGGFAVWEQTSSFRPIGYGGLTATYRDVIGATQLTWVAIGVVALARPATRGGFRALTPLCLSLLVGAVVAVTAVHGGVDEFALFSIVATLVPLVAMTGVLCHPAMRPHVLRALVDLAVAATTAVVLATLAANAVATVGGAARGSGRTLGDRFDVFLAGNSGPTYSGALLAGFIGLTPAVRPRLRALSLPILAAGVVLTQTRGSVLATVAGVTVIALADRRLRVPAAAAAVVAVVAFTVVSSRPLASISDSSNVVRRQNLVHHVALLENRPLGYGLSRDSVGDVRSAHHTQLGLANAAGPAALLLWLVAWCWPPLAGFRRDPSNRAAVAAVAAVTATIVTWSTTGNEVLISAPPTNLLPLALGVALAAAVPRRAAVLSARASRGALRATMGLALAWLALTVLPPVVASYGRPDYRNLVRNASFEVGLSGWSAPGAGITSPPVLRTVNLPAVVTRGDEAVLVEAPNPSSIQANKYLLSKTRVPVAAGRTYALRATVSGVASRAHPIRLGLRWNGGPITQRSLAPAGPGGSGIVKTLSGNATVMSGSFTTPRGVKRVQVAVWKNVPAGATRHFAVDDVVLHEEGSSGAAGGNRVRNGSFEDGTAMWVGADAAGSAITLDQRPGFGTYGSRALAVAAADPTGRASRATIVSTVPVRVRAGERYYLRGAVRTDGSVNVRLGYRSNGGPLTQRGLAPLRHGLAQGPRGRAVLEGVLTIPDGVRRIRVAIWADVEAHARTHFLIDDVMLTRGPSRRPFLSD